MIGSGMASASGRGLLAGISDEKLADIRGRVTACDADGLSSLLGISGGEALRLIVREKEAGSSERKVLRTADARRLKRDLLNIFAAEASSSLAKKSLLLLQPSLDRKEIQGRLELHAKGSQAYEALKLAGRDGELRSVLARLSFVAASKTDRKALEPSETLAFFTARKQMIEALDQVLTTFRDTGPVVSMLGTSDSKTLRDVLRSIEEAGTGKLEDAEAVISDAEAEVNDAVRRGGRDRERVLAIVEEKVAEVVSALKLSYDEEVSLRRAGLGNPSMPFEFDRAETRKTIAAWRKRKEDERAAKVKKVEASLRQHMSFVESLIERALVLDQSLAVASAADMYSLVTPSVGKGGIGFLGARSPFLMRRGSPDGGEAKEPAAPLQSVSYTLGSTGGMRRLAKPRNAVMLTGANSGGKTTLLNTVASIHILTLLGLPVPAESAEVAPMPVYLFRKRTARRSGSLEHVLRSLIPILADRQRKLVLIDELEALTEPGAAGRIIASIINRAAATSSLFLLVTHLAKETLPYVKLPVRVDGIEASGLDANGELVVDRQPVFDHIGSSTPKLIVMKLAKASRKEAVKTIYNDLLASLEGEAGSPIQAPIAFPWMEEGS